MLVLTLPAVHNASLMLHMFLGPCWPTPYLDWMSHCEQGFIGRHFIFTWILLTHAMPLGFALCTLVFPALFWLYLKWPCPCGALTLPELLWLSVCVRTFKFWLASIQYVWPYSRSLPFLSDAIVSGRTCKRFLFVAYSYFTKMDQNCTNCSLLYFKEADGGVSNKAIVVCPVVEFNLMVFCDRCGQYSDALTWGSDPFDSIASEICLRMLVGHIW